ncbi:bifunctional DNA primase/polymerase [Mycolicibacter kumamotonensis]|uniref:DNA primase/polymerase bifunctional N-terminal domain-containing protein n=1 Tax=Mycolicibacter kumamotonensis TaxID=354243 RepID=A0A1B8SCP4_9MYCO|nr:bifunctional DNA primase/polymerase [Mycolicibacter kumamotonensis]OBY30500.1 hypothetical protein ACT18_17310 [Mycolicibacter kumamotonensis]
MSLPDNAEFLAAVTAYAGHGWRVFPLVPGEKFPAIPTAHPRQVLELRGGCIDGARLVPNPQRDCRGECGRDGHGLYDATTDVDRVFGWWGGSYAGCNIGGRVPESMFVVDVDPRHGGDNTLAALEAKYGQLPETLMTLSGRGDGGKHLFFRRPPGKLSAARLGRGIDLKTSAGYVVMPPSIHPDSAECYTSVEAPVAVPPGWLVNLLRPEVRSRGCVRPRRMFSSGKRFGVSVADSFCEQTSWAEILEPHGWACSYEGDPCDDEAGAVWLHPEATSSCSATVRYGLLFVWSTNTPFEATACGDPHGYTKFKAYAVLNHDGDMSAAARALITQGAK